MRRLRLLTPLLVLLVFKCDAVSSQPKAPQSESAITFTGRVQSQGNWRNGPVTAAEGQRVAPFNFDLVAGGGTILIWGHVTAMGKPIAGALVGLWRQPRTEPNADDVIVTVRTDRDGKYELQAPAGNHFIAVKADGFVDAIENEPLLKSLRRVRVLEGSWPQTVDFELVPAASLEGTVKDDHGNPVSQTSIRLVPFGMPAVSLPFWSSPRTDELGRYRITGLPAGRYWIAAGELAAVWETTFGRSPRRRTFYPDAADQSQAKLVDISPGAQIKQIDINMGPALRTFTMRVHLVADRDGQIPEDVDFILEAFSQGQHAANARPRAASIANGEIVIPDVPAGEYMIHVWSGMPPYRPDRFELVISNPKLLGQSDRIEIVDRDVSFNLHITKAIKP